MLKCFFGIAGTALVAAGIAIVATAKTAATLAVGIGVSPVLPMLALLLIIGGIFLLPFICIDFNYPPHRHHVHRPHFFPVGRGYHDHVIHHYQPAVVVVDGNHAHHPPVVVVDDNHHHHHHGHGCTIM
jgi:hypothetical protein